MRCPTSCAPPWCSSCTRPTTLRALAAWIEGAPAWYLQSFIDAESVLAGPGRLHAWNPDDLRALLPELQALVPGTALRGVD